MRVEGTIVEAGTLENKGSATCGVVVKVPQAQRMEMMRLYARDVVVMPKADYDAREEGIEQLCEQMGQLRVALAAREAEEERLRDVKLQRVAEGMSRWCKPQSPHLAAIADALDAFIRRDYKHTLEELAQCGAVIVRMMEAVQALVDEAAKAGNGAKE